MINQERKQLIARICVISVFAVIFIAALTWLGSSWYSLLSALSANQERFMLNIGAFYLIGALIILGCLIYAFVYETIVNKPPSSKIMPYILILGVIAILFMPKQLGNYYLNEIENKNYAFCEKESYEWLFYKEYVFARNLESCRKR